MGGYMVLFTPSVWIPSLHDDIVREPLTILLSWRENRSEIVTSTQNLSLQKDYDQPLLKVKFIFNIQVVRKGQLMSDCNKRENNLQPHEYYVVWT